MKKKKSENKKRDKLLLETSVQIGKFIPDPKGSILKKLPSDSDLYSSYFCLYEFKVGLIRNLIEFYYLVKLYDKPSDAIGFWSKKFGKRELKNKIILESLMAELYKSINTQDTEEYLRQVEGVIFWLVSNFDTELRGMVGDFGSDSIVKFELYSSEYYQIYLDHYNKRKCIPLGNFWKKHSRELSLLIKNKDQFDKSKVLQGLYEKLNEISKDYDNSNKTQVNKSIGDAVIAVDCPSSMKVTTLDKSFKTICPIKGFCRNNTSFLMVFRSFL